TSAGHIPGATMYRYRGEKDVLFSGDVQTIPTHLVGPARPLKCDILVLESTYAGREHADRKETERRFRDKVAETVERGGQVIIPAFAVGRAQEVLMSLASSGFNTWLDGMARKVNDIYLSAPEYLADSRRFRRALEGVHVVQHPAERKQALREADVIVSTGGMLDGGPVLYYLGERYRDANSSILLTGFQVDGSNGRQLLDQGTLTIDEVTIRPECEVLKFDISAHAAHTDLVNNVRATEARHLILMHGDQREALAEAIGPECEVLMPQNGEKFTI
ncbi:MAG: MBL fold metallo-hydrolase, partial [Thermoplasmata archaeon]|nr:MBL fold metallo-hydrolase [Thermoplasmata archaeon]